MENTVIPYSQWMARSYTPLISSPSFESFRVIQKKHTPFQSWSVCITEYTGYPQHSRWRQAPASAYSPNPSRIKNRSSHTSLDLGVSLSGLASGSLFLFCSFPKSLDQFILSLSCLSSLFLALALLFFFLYYKMPIKLTVELQQLPSRNETVSCQAPNYMNAEVRKKERDEKGEGERERSSCGLCVKGQHSW